ncbi:hypothetical protein LOTGIDRAFT_171719 [Lottia gigantea]|uniref:Uncharacterized protein n=1 Tax=Lottia gigantea TaxID=225164 RepID=V4CLE5_LOTGI|nr:hypothetical protein LOTGIDRAFT_171719 [Lottia gigantea]ESP03115.1 hypothetical protein LOTGIDRAFT_171719 [Lottia gigantea]
MDWNTVYSDSPRLTAANSFYQNVRHGRLRYLKALLDRGVNVNCKNDFGENVLVAALRIDNDVKRRKAFKYLIKKGADIHFKDEKHGRSVLLWVCYFGRENELSVLLKEVGSELDIQEKDNQGSTCLHYATSMNSSTMVLALVKMFNRIRISVDIADGQGFTPYILARRLGHRDVANILLKQGNASPAQFDSKRFRTCREWSQYGKWERYSEVKTREMKEMAINKVRGDFKTASEEFPSSRSTSDSDQAASEPEKIELPSLNIQKLSSAQQSVTPEDNVDGFKRLRTGSITAMSLLDMTSLDRGHLVRNFQRSEFDTTKSADYNKDIYGNLSSIMQILSQQNSTSFRKSVKEAPPPVHILEHIESKPKVSSLAIIMGKRKNGVKRKQPSIRNNSSPHKL